MTDAVPWLNKVPIVMSPCASMVPVFISPSVKVRVPATTIVSPVEILRASITLYVLLTVTL